MSTMLAFLVTVPAFAQLGNGGFQYWSQDVVPGATPDSFDAFGSSYASGDFNGDGFIDLAVGEPGATVNGVTGAGEVHVFYYNPPSTSFWVTRIDSFDLAQFYSSGTAAPGSSFGFSVAAADFDGDGFDDLAIGAPFASVETPSNESGVEDAGTVLVIYGSSNDLNDADFQFLEDDLVEESDHFGWALVAGTLDPGPQKDLVVGVPGEDLAVSGPEIADAGKVANYIGTSGQLAFTSNSTQEGAGGSSEAFDRFGSVLAMGDLNDDGTMDRLIGVPDEDIGAINDAGAVFIFYSGISEVDTFISQSDLGGVSAETDDRFGTAIATGDFNGDGVTDLAVGSPFEDITGTNEGLVNVVPGSNIGLVLASGSIINQGIGGSETPEDDDAFGSALAAGDFNGDGIADLVVGAPNEDLNGETVADAGIALLLFGSNAGLTGLPSELWSQTAFNSGQIEMNDQATSALHAADFNNDGAADFVLGAPFENDQSDTDSGAFQVFFTLNSLFEDGFESGDTSAWSSTSP